MAILGSDARVVPNGVYVAVESFACVVDDPNTGRKKEYTVIANKTRVRGSHAVVKANPQYFERVDDEVYRTEQMTANPGERRAAPNMR